MPTIVSYNGKRLIPAPFISFNKTFYKNATENIGATYQIGVQGTIVAFKGSPSPTGTFELGGYPGDFPTSNNARLANILRQQEILREMFSEDFHLFEIQSANGSAPMRFRPRIVSLDIPDGIWFDQCPYTIQMEAPEISVFGAYHGNNSTEDSFRVGPGSGVPVYLTAANENWGVEYDEERDVFLINHTVSAQGRAYYDLNGNYTEPLSSARTWVQSKMGPNVSLINSSMSGTYTQNEFYDYIKSEQINQSDGSIEVNENWVLSHKDYTESYEVNVQDSEEGKTIAIQGSVQGLSTRNFESGVVYTVSKWTAASSIWPTIQGELYDRTLSLSQLSWVNPTPQQWSIGRNSILGSIEYSYSYTDAPPNLIDGARFERITVNDYNAADVFAIIPVLGRAAGPIIQNINTKTEKRRTLTIEVALTGSPITTQAERISYITNWNAGGDRPNYGSITGLLIPSQVRYIEQDEETWDLTNRRGSKVVTWVY